MHSPAGLATLNTLVLGLGLFFLGMQLTGDGLRRLASGGFRHLFQHWTANPFSRLAVGISAGALMQSATAVTFILASMRKAGLASYQASLQVILWCNVGLTALAFVATLPINPVVSFMVGAAGVAAGLIKNGRRHIIFMSVLGLCLVLYGLQTIGGGARPLCADPRFTGIIEAMSSAPSLAFLAGMAAAALLQSNTGAAMVVIALANAGIHLDDSAVMLIYGTNLGSLFLRIILSMGLDRGSVRLVRFEDVFVIWSGLLMSLLYFCEKLTGIPLVLALSKLLFRERDMQLTAVFLMSNAIPAIALCPFTKKAGELLERIIPDRADDDPAKLRYLNSQVLKDPSTAPDVIAMENSRLLAMIRGRFPGADPLEGLDDFNRLHDSIDAFICRLSAGRNLTRGESERIHLARTELVMLRFVEESVCSFKESLLELDDKEELDESRKLVAAMSSLLESLESMARSLNPEQIEAFIEETSKSGPHAGAAHSLESAARTQEFAQAAGRFADCVTVLHKFAKSLRKQAELHAGGSYPADGRPHARSR